MIRFVLAALVAAGPGAAFAQPPATPAPAPTAPAPAQKPPAPATPPAAAPQPPKPFPEGARVAFIVLQRIVNESAEGKAASSKIQALQQKRSAELQEKNKSLVGLQQKLEKEGSVMSAQAQGEMQKQVEKAQVDLQRAQQDAEKELQDLQGQLQADFTRRVEPIIGQIGAEKGLHMIFNGPDSGLVWGDQAIDLTAEVVKRLDAKPAGPAPAAPTKPPGL